MQSSWHDSAGNCQGGFGVHWSHRSANSSAVSRASPGHCPFFGCLSSSFVGMQSLIPELLDLPRSQCRPLGGPHADTARQHPCRCACRTSAQHERCNINAPPESILPRGLSRGGLSQKDLKPLCTLFVPEPLASRGVGSQAQKEAWPSRPHLQRSLEGSRHVQRPVQELETCKTVAEHLLAIVDHASHGKGSGSRSSANCPRN